MGHCIQAIVAETQVADAICTRYPELPRVDTAKGFSILPVDAEFVDHVADARSPEGAAHEFMLLTGGFRDFLRKLSQPGKIAYIETDYAGGTGGQGAAVYFDGVEIVAPEWSSRGAINRALKCLGVRRPLLGDRFSAIGLPKYRSNDALLDAGGPDNLLSGSR